MGPLPMQTLANETSAQNGLAASPQFSDSSQTPKRDGVNLLVACLESKRQAFIYPFLFFSFCCYNRTGKYFLSL